MPEPSDVKTKKLKSRLKQRLNLKRSRVSPKKNPKGFFSFFRRYLAGAYRQSRSTYLRSLYRKLAGLFSFKQWRDFDPATISPPIWQALIAFLVVILLIIAISNLVHPDSPLLTPANNANCQTKINGEWQANWGTVTLQEQTGSSLVKGEYTYTNIDRGKVAGKLTGNLTDDVLDFAWQETAERGIKQQGKGTFLFQNQCQDFFGSYGLGESKSGRGNWRGSIVKAMPISKNPQK